MLKFAIKSLLAASICLSAIIPVSAAQVMPQKPLQLTENAQVIQVRDGRRGFYRHRNHGYYNGHRGYRDRRAGYRRYNGYWFPPAAFALGAIIGGTINNNSNVRPGYLSPQHIRYCENRYRSYRQYDNTFQPYNGPRQACRSPYY
ncbi:BA14K-like protein [Hoeflea marina]|uniref:Lectin-like protein BA14k n=1 Tax=Hoeflea marina TaxID=274592 RepID=A0A317PLG3_9HYPH|nr:BA14K family protein [Hoeflea marina]PWW01587.1 BA14K-like protein [Hoeflea marina]